MEVLTDIPLSHIQKFGINNSKIVIFDSNLSPNCMLTALNLCENIAEVILEPIGNEKF